MFLGTNPTAAPYNAVFVDDDIAQLTMDFTFANPGIWRLEIRRSSGGSVSSVTLDFAVFDPASIPRVGQSFGNARVAASNDAARFCITGLPDGLSFDADAISDTPCRWHV